MFDILSSAVRASVVLFVLCGLAYPLTVTLLGQQLIPFQANGSLIKDNNGAVLGSQLIGQQWNDPQWFHGRPSATMDTDPNDPAKTMPAPYNAANSSGSNLGPTSQALEGRVVNDWKALDDAEPDVTWNALPADMLTTSGSGLDADISPANAALQVKRVANKARHRGREAPDQPFGACRNGVEHRLHVRRRTGDHLENVGGRGLPLQRFLGLVEQPGILDRDQGLVAEGFGQCDFAVAEHAGSSAAEREQANAFPLA